MGYRPTTSKEINLFKIENGLKRLKKGTITVKYAALNKRFDRLKTENVGMWEELYPKYIQIVKDLGVMTLA